MPGHDRWSKRFFRDYFIVLMVCFLSCIAEAIFQYYHVYNAVLYIILLLESLVPSLPLPMLTIYLLHYCDENPRSSRLLRMVSGLWIIYFVMLVSAPFIDYITRFTADGQYVRGPWYPLLLLPLIAIMLLNLAGTMRRRKRLSHKSFLSFLIAILPITLSLLVQLFVDVFPLLDISIVLSALSMYSLILSDQIEKDLRHQQELTEKQREIANQRASIMVLQMRPHFIYNTLMAIYSLCNQDPQKARQVTMDFTDYLRRNFNAVVSENNIPFSIELDHTRAYLAVEQAQYEDMLLVEYDTQFTRFRLPPLTLQPLVENAVKHGMNPYTGPLHVLISTYRTDHTNVIIVEDNGPGFIVAVDSASHTTLTNIRQRLELMCGGKLEIMPRDGGGTMVMVTIPDHDTNDLPAPGIDEKARIS